MKRLYIKTDLGTNCLTPRPIGALAHGRTQQNLPGLIQWTGRALLIKQRAAHRWDIDPVEQRTGDALLVLGHHQ